ncbi:MAG: hypothetical protein AAGG02_20910 [Cyanobacteria bacterium P01_H01_bin.15]
MAEPNRMSKYERSIEDEGWVSSIYGLGIQVNAPLSGGIPVGKKSDVEIDVAIELGPFPDWLGQTLQSGSRQSQYQCEYQNKDGTPIYVLDELDGEFFHLQYERIEFVLTRQGDFIWGQWSEPLTWDDASLFVLGPVLGLALRLRGSLCLHSSSIAITDKAFAIIGPSGAGKSTTAAALLERGYCLLGDDILPLHFSEAGIFAIPGYPRLRLWPTSVEALKTRSLADCPPLSSNHTKRAQDIISTQFISEPMPLKAIYVLDWASKAEKPYIEPLDKLPGWQALCSNIYRPEWQNATQRQQEFLLMGNLLKQVPLRHLRGYRVLDRLEELCETIVADFKMLEM